MALSTWISQKNRVHDKRIDANRQNATKSTGLRRSTEGKAAVCLNALRHGLRSEEILLPEEDEEALRELNEYLRAELQPVGELEKLLFDRVAAYWRFRRVDRVEAGIFTRFKPDSDTAALYLTFIRDANGANAFSKLSRYETAIERQIYRALHELERRQAARSGATPTPPQVVDVDVSGIPEGMG